MKKPLEIAKNLHNRSNKISEQLPTLKKLLEQIDNKIFYQDTKVRGIAQEREYLENNVVVVIHKIMTCFEKRYGALFCDIDNPSAEILGQKRLKVTRCYLIYAKCLIQKVNEVALQKQLEQISFMYQHFHAMPIFGNCNVEDVKSGVLSLVKICQK